MMKVSALVWDSCSVRFYWCFKGYGPRSQLKLWGFSDATGYGPRSKQSLVIEMHSPYKRVEPILMALKSGRKKHVFDKLQFLKPFHETQQNSNYVNASHRYQQNPLRKFHHHHQQLSWQV